MASKQSAGVKQKSFTFFSQKFPFSKLYRILITSLACFLLPWCASAQDSLTGTPPFGNYEADTFNVVNTQNLNFMFSIPITSIPGRGINTNVALYFNQSIWRLDTDTTFKSPSGFAWRLADGLLNDQFETFAPGWNLGQIIPYVRFSVQDSTCETPQQTFTYHRTTNYVVVEPNGTTHPLPSSLGVISGSPGLGVGSCPNNTPSGTLSALAIDKSGFRVDVVANATRPNPDPPIAYSPSGLKIISSLPFGTRPTLQTGSIEDVNGNTLKSVSVSPTEVDWTDTLGRTVVKITVVLLSNGLPGQYQYQTPNTSGTFNMTTVTLQAFSLQTNFACPQGHLEANDTGTLPTKITLPNSKTYTFNYEPTPGNAAAITARLSSVVLPTGATYDYSYPDPNDGVSCVPELSGNFFPHLDETNNLTRTVVNGSSILTERYTWARLNSNSVQTTLTTSATPSDPQAVTKRVLTTTNGQLPVAPFTVINGTAEQTFDFTGTKVLRTVVTNEEAQSGFPVSKVTILEDSQTQSETDYSYGVGAVLLSQVDYDFGAGSHGPLLRSATNTYKSDPALTSKNLLDRIQDSTISDSSGTVFSRTHYDYDEFSFESCPPLVPGHDDSILCTDLERGNPTTITRYLDPVTPGQPIIRRRHYDWFGNMVEADVDCCIHETWNFSATTQYAYPDSVIRGPAGGPQLTTSTSYDSATGLLVTQKDENQQPTKYEYKDPLNRLTKITFPDLGTHVFSYDDTLLHVTEQDDIGGGLTPLTTVGSYDALGQLITTQLTSDPQGTVTKAIGYDALGRKKTISNPYRSSDPILLTTNSYDELGRITQVIPPDGTAQANYLGTAYFLNATTVTDEAGKQRRSISDALGRLVEVDEPGDSFPGAPATGSITLGNILTATLPATQGNTSFNIACTRSDCSNPVKTQTICQAGRCRPVALNEQTTIKITVNGFTTAGVVNGGALSVTALATAVSNALNAAGSPVTAASNGTTITMTANSSVATGSASNFAWSSTVTWDTANFPTPAYFPSPASGSLSGGQNSSAFSDSGVVTLKYQNFTAQACYGNSTNPFCSGKPVNSTGTAVASALASAINIPGSPLSASPSLSLTTTSPSSGGTVTVTSQSDNPAVFPQGSFNTSATLVGATPEGPSLDHNFFVTLYNYDPQGNLLSVTQKGDPSATTSSDWRVRTFTYDALSRLVCAANPEIQSVTCPASASGAFPSGAVVYSYDDRSNLLTKTGPAPNQTGAATVTVNYGYDALNRLTGKSYSDGTTPAVTYNYDEPGCLGQPQCFNLGHRTSMFDAGGSEAWAYDVMGHSLVDKRITNGVTRTTTYGYNLMGSVTALQYPSGDVVNYKYNSAGQPISAADQANSYAHDALYAPHGALSSIGNGTALNSTFYYNSRLQPCRISARSSGTAPSSCADTGNIGNVLDYSYNFSLGAGDNGNVAAITNNRDTTRSETFTYDPLNRLSTAQTTSTASTSPSHCWGESYGYDAWGNLNSIVGIQPQFTGCTQESGFTFTANSKNQFPIDCYDSTGNMLDNGSCPGGTNPVHAYKYDAENHLISTADVTYVYDGDGKRVEKSNGKLYWYGMGADVLDETDLAGNLTNEYVFFGGKRTARRSASGTVNYYFADHLGTARIVTNAAGTVLDDSDFYPYGGERQITSSSGNSYRFTGKERDTESGLDNFGARYYGSAIGRFSSVDPFTVTPARVIDPQQLNLYAYVRNNPLKHIDPTGMIIDDAACKQNQKNCGKDWQKILDIANQTDKNGNYTHPELHNILEALQNDARTFTIENSKLDAGTAGLFTITNFTADGKDFTKATLQLDFKQIKNISEVTGADLVPNFNKYQGLLSAPNDRLAETFGHEGAHGLFSIQNPAQAVGIQQLLNDRDASMKGYRYPYPPDVMQKIEAAAKALIPTERFAQQEEKVVNGELQADKKKQ